MNVALYIAKRYIYSRSKSSAINIITAISIIAIVVGAMVMFVILSAFSGLREYSLLFINASDPDLRLTAQKGKTIQITAEQKQLIDDIEHIASYSTFLQERVLLRYDQKELITHLKGVDTTYRWVNPIQEYIYIGRWVENYKEAVVGYGIAKNLSIGVFDYNNALEIMVPKPGKGTISHDDYNKVGTQVSGIYSFEDVELDARNVLVDIQTARILLDKDDSTISGIEFKLTSHKFDKKVKEALYKIFGDDVQISNRNELNEVLHKMHNTENIIVYLVITLIIIVTLFTLVGTIIISIIDKKEHIRTIYVMGLTIGNLRKIFLFKGLLLTFLGCVVGLLLGIIIVVLQKQFGLWMINQHLAYPVAFTITNIAITFFTIIFLGILASKIASDKISKKILER
ncbi:MAG: ABC transporter permease [Bacteroidota bacterium]|nr:ABC transporter permease [Bacteroidota bacterium]